MTFLGWRCLIYVPLAFSTISFLPLPSKHQFLNYVPELMVTVNPLLLFVERARVEILTMCVVELFVPSRGKLLAEDVVLFKRPELAKAG